MPGDLRHWEAVLGRRKEGNLADHFDTSQILEIISIVIKMNVWTRLELAEGAMPAPLFDS